MPPRLSAHEIGLLSSVTRRRTQSGVLPPVMVGNAAHRAQQTDRLAGQTAHISSLLITHDEITSLNLRALICGLSGSVSCAASLGGMA